MVETTNIEDVYLGNSSTTTFYPVTFQYIDKSHVFVDVDGQPYNTFSLTTDGILTDTAIPSSSQVRVFRLMPVTQPYEFPDFNSIDPARVEEAYDWVVMLIQQIKAQLDG